MGIGAVFIIVLVVLLVALFGVGLYVLTMWLRHRQLDPEGDKVEGPDRTRQGSGGEQPRPRHLEVDGEQRSRFVGSR